MKRMLALLLLVAGITGCKARPEGVAVGTPAAAAVGADQTQLLPRMVLMLLDETCPDQWPAMIEAARIVNAGLRKNDLLGILTVDDVSAEDEDLKLRPEPPAGRTYDRLGRSKTRSLFIQQLQPHLSATARGTQICQGFRHAADAAVRYAPSYPHRVVVLYCGDGRQNGKGSSDRRTDMQRVEDAFRQRPFAFPAGTQVRFLFVPKDTQDSTHRGDLAWELLANAWCRFFDQRVGVAVTPRHFYQVPQLMDARGGHTDPLVIRQIMDETDKTPL